MLLIFEGVADFVIEMFNVVRNKVGEVTVLRMVPDLLGRIQLRSVCGKPLEGALRGSDVDWHEYRVAEGRALGLVLNDEEIRWLHKAWVEASSGE